MKKPRFMLAVAALIAPIMLLTSCEDRVTCYDRVSRDGTVFHECR